jgi:molybdenum cofactor cytidylyltransferase
MNASPYGGAVLEHFRRPRNYGALPNATVEAEGANPLCGDRVRVALALDAGHERIEEARFTANACAICIAAASLLTERMRGMARPRAAAITDDEMVEMLDTELPPSRRRCATLALEAARAALASSSASRGVASHQGASGVAAVVLAAGNARRFGGAQKLLAEVPDGGTGDRSLVRRAVIELQRGGLDRLIVVIGRDGDRVRERLIGLELEIVSNAAYEEGMSSSLRTGVRAALERWSDIEGILIALGDQPLTDDRILPRLLTAFGTGSVAPIVAPRYRGVRGNPVLFSREVAGELLAVTGDRGAREVVERDSSRVLQVDLDCEAPLDVDTPEDLVRLAGRLAAGGG